jgi:hypothetical protein
MGIATHLGPWLLGTTRYTTGTTADTTRNTGATTVVQTKAVAFNDADNTTAFALPAGALITRITFTTLTTFDQATTILLAIGGTTITEPLTVTDPGITTFACDNAEAAAALWSDVGATDVFLTYTVSQGSATAGAGEIVIQYVVRNSDGTMYQSSSQV